jgi:predicted ribosomally synthesized peptide with SipW-like signal peptide
MREHMDISRRRLLKATGAIGLSGVGAGVGTRALLSDTESFERNTLAAGDLDLKIDWQQTYSGPNPDTGEVERHGVNAYPDHDGDGLQSFNEVQYGGPGATQDASDIPAVCCDCGIDEYLLFQETGSGRLSTCIEPIRGDDPIEEFYDYSDGSPNTGFEQTDRSAVFLYEETGAAADSDEGDLSLVFVHDVADSPEEGSEVVVFDFPGGLPDDGESWLVVEEGNDTLTTASARFQWGGPYGDGGAYGHLADDFGPITLVPDFSASDVTDWVAISSDRTDPIELDVTEPLTLSARCSARSGKDLEVPDVFQSDGYPDQEHLIELADVKPGDTGEITFSIHNCGNPGYLWLDFLNLTGGENGMTEPEATVDDDGGSELAENVYVRLWYDEDCNNAFDGGERTIYPDSGYASVRTLFDSAGQSVAGGRRLELDGDPYGSSGRDPVPGNGTTLCIGLEWTIPTDVGNEIQTDSLGFDLRGYTEQSRNNTPAP